MRYSQRLALTYIRTKFKLLSVVSKRKAAEKAFLLFCTPQYRNRKKLPRIFEAAEKIRFRFLNYTLAGYRWNAGAGKKCLILHGFESSVINFDRYVKPLIAKGYCVIAFDAPAHGRSTGTTVNVLIYKQFILALYKEYGPFNSFIAHSLGGLALSLALEDIEHNKSTKIAMIAPAAETTTAIDTFFNFLKLPAEVRPEFDTIILKNSGHPASWFSVPRALTSANAEVLLCQDRDDDMTPIRDLEPLMEKKLPNVRFLITEGLGHRRIYRDNKVSKAIIEFL
jgi:alpha-beta hydrolase superfamily lysophospholipase